MKPEHSRYSHAADALRSAAVGGLADTRPVVRPDWDSAIMAFDLYHQDRAGEHEGQADMHVNPWGR